MAQSGEMRIGELARRSGCKIETIRYYEHIGLLPHPSRSAARYRLYGSSDAARLAFVRRARELGFSLDEVRALLALSGERNEAVCEAARHVAVRHLADIRSKIDALRAMERALADAVRRCDAEDVPGCPLIEALSTR